MAEKESKESKVEKITISKEEYNNLCDLLRHLLTLSKKVDKRSNKLHEVISNLNDELREERKALVSKVQSLETIINNLRGDNNES